MDWIRLGSEFQVVPLTADRKEDILRQIEQWAKNGLRTLSLAQRELSLGMRCDCMKS